MVATAIPAKIQQRNPGISVNAKSWFAFAIFVSAAILAITVASPYLPLVHPVIDRLLELANLRAENNFAAWWSGILLIMSSVHAFDGWVTYKETDRRLAIGWLSLALILAALSADEIASLHERLSYFPAGMWIMLIPFALIFGGMFLVTARAFWGDPEHRGKMMSISVAFFLFALVAVQEYIEHAINWPEAWLSVRAGFEEGTELLAMLILLKVTMANSKSFFQPATFRRAPSLVAPDYLRTPLVIAGVFIAPLIAIVTAALPDVSTRGNPANWVASATFFLAALISLTNYQKCRTFPGLMTVIACVIGSLAIVLDPQNTLTIQMTEVNKRLIVYIFVAAAVLADWWSGNRERPGSTLVFAFSFLMLAVSYGATWSGAAIYYLLPQYVALLVFWFVGSKSDEAKWSNAIQGLQDRHGVTKHMPIDLPGDARE